MSNPLRNNWDLVLSGLMRCVHNAPFLERYANFIKPKYFYEGDSDPKVVAMRKMFEIVMDIYRQRRHRELLGATLSFEQEVMKLSDGEVLDEAMAIIQRFYHDQKLIAMANSEPVESQFLDYLKMVKVREWTQAFSEPWKAGRMKEAQDQVAELSSELKMLDRRQYEELEAKNLFAYFEQTNASPTRNFRIGIPKLDQDNGWIEAQTLNLFAAPPGRGKSMMANTLVRLAIKQGKYVHITVVENRMANFIPRIVASLTGISIFDLKNRFGQLSSEMQARVRKAAELVEKYVTVTFMYSQGIEAVHAHKIECDALRAHKKLPPIDIDIVDYTGHIVHYSGNSNDPMHTRFRNAYAFRKDYALKRDKICFDFVQINRSGTKKNDFGGGNMIGMEDLATSFDLAQVADTLITINQSDFDRNTEESDLYIAKGREGGLGEKITVKTAFKYGRFDMNWDRSIKSTEENMVTEGLDEEIIGRTQRAPTADDVPPNNVLPIGSKQ